MDQYHYSFTLSKKLPRAAMIKVGTAGSGNLEIIIKPKADDKTTDILVNTPVQGFKTTWDAVIERYISDYPYTGLDISLNDAGATPPVVALRLRQAIETYQSGYLKKENYSEANARSRIIALVDDFTEFLLEEATPSPNLPLLNIQVATDDGVVIGEARLAHYRLAIMAQEKDFMGGSVGEVHGAKINGLIRYAIKNQLPAIVFLIDSGGVRLQEANVGEIEISEIIRSVLEARSLGIKTIGIICGANGAYGGMGIFSACLDYLMVNRGARIGVSGAEVIQAVEGAEVLDSRDRALVWRIYGGRTRYLQQAALAYTSNKISDIRDALLEALSDLAEQAPLNLDTVLAEHAALQKRIASSKTCHEEGEYLKKYQPDLYRQDLFNRPDLQFLALVKDGNKR
jgi:malonate decarboxylase beta subunit